MLFFGFSFDFHLLGNVSMASRGDGLTTVAKEREVSKHITEATGSPYGGVCSCMLSCLAYSRLFHIEHTVTRADRIMQFPHHSVRPGTTIRSRIGTRARLGGRIV